MTDKNNLEKILTEWNFPLDIVHKYKIIGIKDIFDWQYECLKNNQLVTDEAIKKSFVYAAPTSAGKTLVAELLMLKNVLDLKRKAIMIFPYVSLAKEKLKHLQVNKYYEKASNLIDFLFIEIK
jgi:DNA polymerase theta